MNDLMLIEPARMHEWWPRIRPGVVEVSERTGDTAWIPEDVYGAIRQNTCVLLVGMVDGEMRGFAVVTPVNEYAGMRAHVWIMHWKGEGDFLAIFGDSFEQFCRRANARAITFDSPRKGWERRIAPAGYLPEFTRYRKALT